MLDPNSETRTLEANRDQIEKFVNAIFHHAGESGIVAIRSFYEGDNKREVFAFKPTSLDRGLGPVVDAAVEIANRAAKAQRPVNFCPPLAIFTNRDHAREEDIDAGLAITVECDRQPSAAREALEHIIGKPTVVVESGGIWVNGGGSEQKLHLHWRLKVPARDANIAKLKQARTIATAIVGGDPTNNPVNHPIRWPGSWHRKGEPRPCKIVEVNSDREVELEAALAALTTAAPEAAASAGAPREPGRPEASDDLVSAALAVIPNDWVNAEESWNEWSNRIGLATYRSTAGRVQGFALFDRWSKKNVQGRYDANATAAKWQGYHASPPDSIGFGTLAYLANEAQPGWRGLAGLSAEVMDEVLRLSQLSKAQYEIERKEKAKQLNMRVSVLDRIVANLRPLDLGSDDDSSRQGTKIEFEPIEPWPDAVEGETLITDMKAGIRSHVILSEHQALGTSLWIIHTHALEAAEHTPRLQIKSPTMRCGKSTLLNTIAPMVFKPINTESITTAALFRLIGKYQPTLLIDEADSFLKRDDGKDNEDMRGILNAGHARGGQVIRTVGEDFEPRGFNVFGPVAYAWLVKRGMHVAQTLEDRSITIELRRRLPSETITRLRSTRTSHLRDLARRAARWVTDHIAELSAADPTLPEELNDRAMDNWRPLIAIADAMSADLGQKARDAAIKITEEAIGTGEEDASIIALADVAGIFEARHAAAVRVGQQVNHLSSQQIVEDLIALEDRPWAEWRRGRPITKTSLSRLLKPFGIKPKDIRTGIGNTVLKGYEKTPVVEAKERFVDAAEPVTEQDPDTF
jgi:hypothetical protein